MKRLRETTINYHVNILYFNDICHYLCQFFTIKELLLLETLSTYHLDIIRSTPLHQAFKPAMQIGYLKLISMIKNHEFKHLDLSGTFLHNKHVCELKTPNFLNISNTFVNEKCLKMLKGPYEQLIVSKDLLLHIYNFQLNDLTIYKNLINAVTPTGNTILINCIHPISYPVTDQCYNHMIDMGVDIYVKNNQEMDVLHYAIYYKNENLIKILLKHQLINQTHLYCGLLNHCDVESLISYCDYFDCQCDQFNISPQCCLSLALYHQNDKVAELIMKKMNMNNNVCALSMAVYMENISFAKMLIKYGARSNAGTLINAINNKNVTLINLLPDLDDVNAKGRSGIMHACKQHDMDMVKYLVKLGANTNLKDKYGWHLLSLYLKNVDCTLENVQYLVTLCDVNEVDNQGFSALMIAIIHEHHDIILYLISISNVNIVNQSGHHALYIALEHYQNLEIIKALVSKDPHSAVSNNINIQLNGDFKLFVWALHNHCPNDMIDYLLDLNIDDVYHDDSHALIYMIQENYPIKLFNKMVEKYINNNDLINQCYDIAKQMDFPNIFALFNNLQIIQRLNKIKND